MSSSSIGSVPRWNCKRRLHWPEMMRAEVARSGRSVEDVGHTPPSAIPPFAKPNIISSSQSKGKKERGGQPGHPGKTRDTLPSPSRTRNHNWIIALNAKAENKAFRQWNQAYLYVHKLSDVVGWNWREKMALKGRVMARIQSSCIRVGPSMHG